MASCILAWMFPFINIFPLSLHLNTLLDVPDFFFPFNFDKVVKILQVYENSFLDGYWAVMCHMLPPVGLVCNLCDFVVFSVFTWVLQYCSRGFRGHFDEGGAVTNSEITDKNWERWRHWSKFMQFLWQSSHRLQLLDPGKFCYRAVTCIEIKFQSAFISTPENDHKNDKWYFDN